MRPLSTPSSSSFHVWSSPIPYLFIGLGTMMVLIAGALIILACSHRKSSGEDETSSSSSSSKEKHVISPLDMEPRVVVIMAGNLKPTCLALPLPLHQQSL
ncbi:hypothetical protein J5N97_008016 [Dioscorea zingiberensis]|uniref:Uncharacterized protein n=1 Tax=Dioscorea zingiberensis TaxID=325984 RepID=A0A9D5DDF5_9LILI|nr:hypothetical protein J5N97_008016 [Dioscorea zingiberensis]